MRNKISFIVKKYFGFVYNVLLYLRKILRYNYHKLSPYKYKDSKYNSIFLDNPLKYKSEIFFSEKIDRIIYCFWTGTNEITENRKEGLEALNKYSGVEVKLIKPDNLDEYILGNYPLHPAYQYLSLVHKSDYLRCYFMYHYGGGYSDIKKNKNNWVDIFQELDDNNFFYLAGYPEFDPLQMGGKGLNSDLDKDIFRYFRLCIGNCGFICKPYSPYVAEWYQELHRKLDLMYDDLKLNPGIERGFNKGYPVAWFDILSKIMVPLSLKYNKHILYDKRLMPDFNDYL